MKTRRVVVPRSRIRRHYLHPEVYGESIVELDNGMTSDVYTNDLGELDTDTNDAKLIHYLSKVDIKDEPRIITQDDFSFISITKLDVDQLKKWFEMSPWRQFSLIENNEEIILRYISHARTMNSDVFLAKVNDQPVGLVGYDIIDSVAIVMIEVYEHSLVKREDYDYMINTIKEYVIHHYELEKLILTVFDFDFSLIEALNRSCFTKVNRPRIKVPTCTGSLFQFEYEYILEPR